MTQENWQATDKPWLIWQCPMAVGVINWEENVTIYLIKEIISTKIDLLMNFCFSIFKNQIEGLLYIDFPWIQN